MLSPGSLTVRPLDLRGGAIALPREGALTVVELLATLRTQLTDRHPDLLFRPRPRAKSAGAVRGPAAQSALQAQHAADAVRSVRLALALAQTAREARDLSWPRRYHPFDLPSTLEIHSALLGSHRPGAGALRTQVAASRSLSHSYAFPDPRAVPGLFAALLRWSNRQVAADPVACLEALATAFVQRILIHPFSDGNGRLSRLLLGAELISLGLLDGYALDLDLFSDHFHDELGSGLAEAGRGRAEPVAALIIRMLQHCCVVALRQVAEYDALLDELARQHRVTSRTAAMLRRSPVLPADGEAWATDGLDFDPTSSAWVCAPLVASLDRSAEWFHALES